MSSTRTAEPGSKPRQERFMSSAEFQTGLMANIVAHRCSVEKSSKKRELIYRIQADSHKIGLKKLSEILIERFRDRIATRTMLKPSYREKKTFSIQDTKEIRKDVPSKDFWDSEILRTLGSDLVDVLNDGRSSPRRDALPQSFSAKTFKEECEAFAESKLESFIEELCLNPEIKLDDGPWYFPDLIESLFEHYAELAAIEAGKIVKTGLAKTVHDAMDYSLHSRDLVLVDGRARTGKSTAAKNWVQTHIGQARFAEVPPGDSDIGFFRVIAKALGLSSNLNHKAHEMRDRIEIVLRTGDFLLCLDESQNCWPDSNYRDALPFRVSWLLSMTNARVPIVLIVTDQFFHAQKRTERRSGWTSEQLQGRIGDYKKLPDSLSDEELSAVSKMLLPEGEEKAIRLLVLNAKVSEKYLAGIELAVKKARYLASKAGREKVTIGDLKRAIKEGVIPSDKLLAQALARPEKANGRRAQRNFPAMPEPATERIARGSEEPGALAMPEREMRPVQSVCMAGAESFNEPCKGS